MKSPFYYNISDIRVVDGDTLFVTIDLGFNIKMSDYIRLYDVDCPEIFHPHTPEGDVAKKFTVDWVAGGKAFAMDSRKYDAREKYGRCLADIYRDNDPVTLNQALIASGNIKKK